MQKGQKKRTGGFNKMLIENFVALQKVQADLSEKLNSLTKQISELLKLFEASAKTFAENPAITTSERDKEFLTKINQLLEQDKLIAKGITYIEERITEMEQQQGIRPGVPQPLPKA